MQVMSCPPKNCQLCENSAYSSSAESWSSWSVDLSGRGSVEKNPPWNEILVIVIPSYETVQTK
jgi:hypothetical protein